MERFVETEEEQDLGFSFFKSFRLKTLIAFVTLFRNETSPGDTGARRTARNKQRHSGSSDSHDCEGIFAC